jgi:hypothetical protein
MMNGASMRGASTTEIGATADGGRAYHAQPGLPAACLSRLRRKPLGRTHRFQQRALAASEQRPHSPIAPPIRTLAVEATDNGLLAQELAAGIQRVKIAKAIGVRTGNWLALQQAQALLNAPEVTTMKGLRDRAMIAVLLGCALRRSEVAALTIAHVRGAVGGSKHSHIVLESSSAFCLDEFTPDHFKSQQRGRHQRIAGAHFRRRGTIETKPQR